MIVDTSAVLRVLFWEEGGWQRATLSGLHEEAAVRRTTVDGVLDTGAVALAHGKARSLAAS